MIYRRFQGVVRFGIVVLSQQGLAFSWTKLIRRFATIWIEIIAWKEVFFCMVLTLNLLTTTIVTPPSNASKWQMGFNSAFKGLIKSRQTACLWNHARYLSPVTCHIASTRRIHQNKSKTLTYKEKVCKFLVDFCCIIFSQYFGSIWKCHTINVNCILHSNWARKE